MYRGTVENTCWNEQLFQSLLLSRIRHLTWLACQMHLGYLTVRPEFTNIVFLLMHIVFYGPYPVNWDAWRHKLYLLIFVNTKKWCKSSNGFFFVLKLTHINFGPSVVFFGSLHFETAVFFCAALYACCDVASNKYTVQYIAMPWSLNFDAIQVTYLHIHLPTYLLTSCLQ